MRVRLLSLFPLSSLSPSHAGLAITQYLRDFEPTVKQELLESIQKKPISPLYKTFFERWKEGLTCQNAVFIEATAATPVAIGLGNASPTENGLSIHHTYGTPYLPGSAIKGMLMRAADKYRLSKEDKDVLFGNPNSAGHIVYWDGWLDPSSKQPFWKDAITVHHQQYYGSQGAVWPTDFDDPNPVSFLSVRPGAKFCLALSSASDDSMDWLFVAARLLEWGMGNLGLGGKTNAGYGYFEVKLPPKPKTQADLAEEVYSNLKAQIAGIKSRDPLRDVRELISKLRLHPVELRGVAVEAILRKLDEIGVSQGDRAKAKALLEES